MSDDGYELHGSNQTDFGVAKPARPHIYIHTYPSSDSVSFIALESDLT